MILTLLLLTVSLSQGREQQWNYIKRKNTHWRSAGQNRGPSEWTGMCNNGEKQSPIDIRKASRRKIYSRSHKEMDTLFPSLLNQILVKFVTKGQFWNLLVLRIPKHPLPAQFDEVLAKLFEVKDN